MSNQSGSNQQRRQIRRSLLKLGLSGTLFGIGAAVVYRIGQRFGLSISVEQAHSPVPSSSGMFVEQSSTTFPTNTLPVIQSTELLTTPIVEVRPTELPTTPTVEVRPAEAIPGQPSVTPVSEDWNDAADVRSERIIVVRKSVVKPLVVAHADWGARTAVGEFIPHQPQKITLHHEGVYFDGSTPAPKYLQQVQRWCMKSRGWPDIPYHFVLDLDGIIYEGRPLEMRGDTNTSYDLQGHALIAVLGKYDKDEQEPNQKQIDSLIALMAWIAATHSIPTSRIHSHRDFIPANAEGKHIDPHTHENISCPGDNLHRYLSDGTIQSGVQQILDQQVSRHTVR